MSQATRAPARTAQSTPPPPPALPAPGGGGGRELALAAVGLAVLIALPWLAGDYVVGVGVTAFTFTAAAVCLNLVYGYAGLLSFAQLAFWGIGGYCTALVVMDAGGSFWSGMVSFTSGEKTAQQVADDIEKSWPTS